MSTTTRRTFAAAAAAALSASRVSGANDRIRVGLIGAGGRGTQLWKVFLDQPDVEPVVVCDLYEPFRDRAATMAANKPQKESSFQRVLDRRDIDAVIIATPDHWHAVQTIAACRAGKDVYVEKPLTLMIGEGRSMIRAARDNKRVVQTGSQQRSGVQYAEAVSLIRSGGIGAVHKISAGYMRNAVPGFAPRELSGSQPPASFDWDAWLGPAPARPFDPFRCIYNFRWFWDYSGGQMTNWGAHHLDIARWILDAVAPDAVAAFGGRYELSDGGETPDVQEVIYQFPKTLVTWTTREINKGKSYTLEIHGTKGTMSLGREGFVVTPESSEGQGQTRGVALMQPVQVRGGDLEKLHIRNFLDCVKSRNRPNADVEEGHRTAVMCHLGNIATRLGRALKWDPVKEQVIDDTEANRWLMKPYRKPWNLS